MRIVCADHSRLGLAKQKRITMQLVPDAEIVGFRKPAEVLALAEEQKIDILLTEVDFGGSRWEGLELVRRVKELQPSVNIILVTAESGRDFSEDMISLRISGFVSKPYEIGDMRKEFENLRYPV
ncbi:MAG: response regulator [Lachnospiraceae bacterium]|nr:response regulator [Lachnospiraceae bacterium]